LALAVLLGVVKNLPFPSVSATNPLDGHCFPGSNRSQRWIADYLLHFSWNAWLSLLLQFLFPGLYFPEWIKAFVLEWSALTNRVICMYDICVKGSAAKRPTTKRNTLKEEANLRVYLQCKFSSS